MKKFLAGFGIAAVVLSVLAWTPTDRNFNRNQFGTNNLSINIKSGATTTNLLHYGSNYFGGPVYHGGGNGVAYFTNGFVVFDSVEQYSGDYIMIDPGSEFIGAHRGNGQYLTNIPQAGVSGLVAALAAKADTNNVTIWNLDARGFQTDSITNLAGNVFALFASGGGFYFYDPNAGNPFMAGDDTTVSLYANAVEVFAGKEDYTEVMAQNTTNKLHISEDGNIFTGPISANGITNSATTDAIIYADANGRHREVTIGANLTFSAGTLSATGGGGGSDTNGISYANVAWPAFGTTGNEEAWLKYTNGVKAITAINDAGSSRLVFTNYDGTYIANFDNTGFIALNITETDGTPVLSQANNVRTLADGNGDVAIDFATKTGITIDGNLLNTPSWDNGEILYKDGSGQISGTDSPEFETIYLTTLRFATNQASDYLVDFNKPYSLLATNDAVTFTACQNVATGSSDTNVQWAFVTITNTAGSAAPKLITMNASFQNMRPTEGNTIYVTNLLKISVMRQHGEGTNFVWLGR